MSNIIELEAHPHGSFTIEVLHRDGSRDCRQVKNLITNAGIAGIAGRVGAVGSPAAFTYLALGIGTTAATVNDTQLESEITNFNLTRAAATMSLVTTTVTNDTSQATYTWTASGNKAITECGILNASSGGTLLGRQVFTAINVESGDQVTVTYKIKIS